MSIETSIVLAIFLGGGLFVTAVAQFKPLTSWEAPVDTLQTRSLPEAAKDGGYAMCQASMPGVDCACFAQKATQVLMEDRPRASGWSYADQWELARAQASDSCS
ncbi:hypothetical protein ACN2XU_06135 [Primorskyibacter sp. 2E107]|uniref:hypothetical protein n=1 Tax=Primorskyibacter sp. 2E107 TaxID=3403458 RepID=UPI003AF7FA71